MIFQNKLALSLGNMKYLIATRIEKAIQSRAERFIAARLALVDICWSFCECKYFWLPCAVALEHQQRQAGPGVARQHAQVAAGPFT